MKNPKWFREKPLLFDEKFELVRMIIVSLLLGLILTAGVYCCVRH
jgi:hypothetical protein